MAIILQGGETSRNNQADAEWVRLTSQTPGESVLFLPYALPKESHQPAFNWFRDMYGQKLNKKTILADENVDILDDSVASIHISGGYTDRLMKILNETGVDKQIIRYSQQRNNLIYACSAGAIALGADIRTAIEVPDDYAPSAGLNLLDGYGVVCHYLQAGHLDSGSVESWSYQRPIIAIPKTSGVLYRDRQLTPLDAGGCEIIQDGNHKVL